MAAHDAPRALLNTIGEATGIVIHPSKLFGSGSLASSTFDYHKVPTLGRITKSKYDWIAPSMTYFGGLIQTPIVGLVNGTVDEEDLNSAYPSVMIHLPCMRKDHGHWESKPSPNGKTKNFTRLGINNYTVGHVNVSWKIPPKIAGSTPPFMVRDKFGSVYQPLTGHNVWVTIPEFLAGIKRFNRKTSVLGR